MKIGILTFHEVFNPGAFMQTLGSYQLLSDLGHEVEVINYNPPVHRFKPLRMTLSRIKAGKLGWKFVSDCIGKNNAFKKDIAKHFSLTPFFDTKSSLSEYPFDAIVIGADIVWNYETKYLGMDSVYFGDSLNCNKLIAFAPSVGSTDISKYPNYVVKGLRSFHSIAVRDKNTQQLVKNCIDKDVNIICDPAFHLKCERFPEGHNEYGNYILVYLMEKYCTPALVLEVKKYAHENNLKIVSTIYRNEWADYNHIVHGPMKWLDLFRHARCVVTNTFHGSVFSIKLQKDFVLVYNELTQAKTQGMIAELKLAGRVYSDAGDLEQILSSTTEWGFVENRIEKWCSHAKQYLIGAINS